MEGYIYKIERVTDNGTHIVRVHKKSGKESIIAWLIRHMDGSYLVIVDTIYGTIHKEIDTTRNMFAYIIGLRRDNTI